MGRNLLVRQQTAQTSVGRELPRSLALYSYLKKNKLAQRWGGGGTPPALPGGNPVASCGASSQAVKIRGVHPSSPVT